MSRAMDDAPDAQVDAPAVDEPGPIFELVSATGSGEDAEPVDLTTILSTLVDASLWEHLLRMDGTTYTGALELAPEPGVSGE